MTEILRQPNEPARQFSALCSFAHMGPGRSLRLLAAKLEISLPTLRGWSGRYRWPLRVEQFDLALCAEERRLQHEALESRAVDWAARREQLWEEEYQASRELFAQASEVLSDPRVVWEARDIIELLQLASDLGRRAVAHVPPPVDQAAQEKENERVAALLRKAYPPSANPASAGTGPSSESGKTQAQNTDGGGIAPKGAADGLQYTVPRNGSQWPGGTRFGRG